MINLTSKGKKLVFFALFLLIPFFVISLHAQDVNFKYKVDSVLSEGTYTYNISVSITDGKGPFIFELLDKAFVQGGKSIEKTTILLNPNYTFKNLKDKEYYVYVYTSNEESGRGKRVRIH